MFLEINKQPYVKQEMSNLYSNLEYLFSQLEMLELVDEDYFFIKKVNDKITDLNIELNKYLEYGISDD